MAIVAEENNMQYVIDIPAGYMNFLHELRTNKLKSFNHNCLQFHSVTQPFMTNTKDLSAAWLHTEKKPSFFSFQEMCTRKFIFNSENGTGCVLFHICNSSELFIDHRMALL
jgi:hypothetical protein